MPAKTTYDVKGNMTLEKKPDKVDLPVSDVAKESKSRSHKHSRPVIEDASSSDSDTDECYEPFSMEAWRYPMYSPSASYRQVDVVSGSHQYTVSGFFLARSMGCGTRLCSDFFEVCGQLFRLEVYPGGFTADTRRYVSMFLTTPGTLNPNHIMYELAILDQSGKDRHIVEKRDSQSRHAGGCCNLNGPMMSHSRGIVAAVPKFIKAGFLIKHEKRYMPCDMLVVRATVQVLRGWSSSPTVHGHMGYHGGMQPGMSGGQIPALGYGAMPGFNTAGAVLSMPPFQQQQQQQHTFAVAPQLQLQQQYQPQLQVSMPGTCVCGGLPPHHHLPLQQQQQAHQMQQQQAHQMQQQQVQQQQQQVSYPLIQQIPSPALYTPMGSVQPYQIPLAGGDSQNQQQWSSNHSQIQSRYQPQQAVQQLPAGYYPGAAPGAGSVQQHQGGQDPSPSSYLVYMSSPSPGP